MIHLVSECWMKSEIQRRILKRNLMSIQKTGRNAGQVKKRAVTRLKSRPGKKRGLPSGALFVLPAFAFIFVFMLYPLVSAGYLSLTEYNFVYDDRPKFVGFQNYMDAFSDDMFITSLVNTFVYGSIYFVLLMAISLAISLLLFQKLRFSPFYKSAVFVPLVVPLSLAALVFLWILQPNFGLLNYFLRDVLGADFLAQPWLSQADTAMGSMIALSLWATIGFETVLFVAGLQSIDQSVLEAADVDGATGLKKVFFVLLPNLRETYILTGTWALLQALKVFIEPMVLTGGGPGVATLVVYQQIFITAFSYFDMGYASAMGYILGFIILLLIVVNFLVFRVRSRDDDVKGFK